MKKYVSINTKSEKHFYSSICTVPGKYITLTVPIIL